MPGSPDVFLYLFLFPCVSRSGYWCPTLDFSCYGTCFRGSLHVSLALASLHWSLFTCLPVWLSTASGVRLVSLHLIPALASDVFILDGVVWLSGCLSLRAFLHVSHALASVVRLSGCFLFAFAWLPSFFSCHLSPDSSPNSRVFKHQSALVVVSDSFACLPLCVSSIICLSQSVSHFVCLLSHMSPLTAVPRSCFITISCVIGPYLCSFLPLRLLVVSGVTPA